MCARARSRRTYLTPFGIWNVDHAPTVQIPVMQPLTQMRNLLPEAQTGIQIHGRLYPQTGLYLDYALTVSNGRGPIDQIIDYDANKALGLRLQLTYETDDFKIKGGAYAYWGIYTDVSNEVTSFIPIDLSPVVQEKYQEINIACDLRIELFGIKIQSEFVNTDRKHLTEPELTMAQAGPREALDAPGWTLYGLVAYSLPLMEWSGDIIFTPYFIYEYLDGENQILSTTFTNTVFGLSVAFTPQVIVKLQYHRQTGNDEGPLQIDIIDTGLISQLAIAF